MDDRTSAAQLDEDLTLRAWDGDESVLADLVVAYAPSLEIAISRRLPKRLRRFSEDVVAEAIQRFWQSRSHFDANKSLRAYLYRTAVNVANNLASGHLIRQKAQNCEVSVDGQWLNSLESRQTEIENDLDIVEEKQNGICAALADSLAVLNQIEREVIEAFGLSDGYEVNTGALGIELGNLYCDGVPIPAGNIRQHKRRAKQKLIVEMRKRGYELEKTGTHS